MEFRLIYDGKLPAASQGNTRAQEKHEIRRALAPQLATLWNVHPRLLYDSAHSPSFRGEKGVARVVQTDHPKYDRYGRTFFPLINSDEGIGCGLDILFLRRDDPGSLVHSGGDLDNRMKVLFDALKMPSHDGEVFGAAEQEPNPFHCLLQDDKLIVDLKITTDRLLTARADTEHENDVRLIIHVRTIVLDPGNLAAVCF